MKQRFSLFTYLLNVAIFILLLSFFSANAENYGSFHYEVYEDNTIGIIGYTEETEYLEIPPEIDGMPVVSVRLSETYRHPLLYKTLREVTLPDGVTKLGLGAFRALYALEKINGMDNIQYVSYQAFDGCSKLKKLVFSSALQAVEAYAFESSGVESITLPDSMIPGDCAFYEMRELNKITLIKTDSPECVLKDGALLSADLTTLYCVPSRSRLTYTVPDTVTTIIGGAFSVQSDEDACLVDLYIPQYVTSIADDAICSSLYNSIPVLHVSEGSVAHQFAVNNRRDYVLSGSEKDISLEQRINEVIDECIVPGMSEYEKAKALHDWLCSNVIYNGLFDETQPSGWSARSALIDGVSICQGFTFAYQFLLNEVGIESHPVLNNLMEHIWNVVCIDGTWTYVDCTLDSGNPPGNTYFGFNDDICFLRYHGTRSTNGNKVDSLKYYQPYLSGEYDSNLEYGWNDIQSKLDEGIYSFELDASNMIATGILATLAREKTFISNGVTYKLYIKPFYEARSQSTYIADYDCYALPEDMDLSELPEDMDFKVSQNGVVITKYLGNSEKVSVPDTILGYPVVRIDTKAFCENETIREVHLPDTVKEIGSNAFSDCIRLTKIELGRGLEGIGFEAFRNSPLQEMILPDSLIKLSDACFSGTQFEHITVPAGITEIPFQCFLRSCLTSIEFDGPITSIGRQAFSNTNLEMFIVPDTVHSIDAEAFSNCESLKKVVISSSVTSIGRNVFTGCMQLECIDNYASKDIIDLTDGMILQEKGTYLSYVLSSVENLVVPDTVTVIADFLASDHPNLKTVTMGDSVTTMGRSAFSNCRKLESIRFSDNITVFPDGVLWDAWNLSQLHLPKNLKEADLGTVFGSMEYIMLPPVTRFKNWSVHLENAKRIILPEGVQQIDTGAFISTKGEFWLPDSLLTINDGIFFSGTEGVTIVCNIGSKAEEYAIKAGIPYIRYPSLSETCITLVKGQCMSLPIQYDGLMEFEFMSCISEDPSVAVYENGMLNGISAGSTTLHIAVETLEFILSVTVEDNDTVFPGALTTIRAGSFTNTAFISIEIPDSVVEIENHAFSDCKKLERITIPQSVTSIADNAFESCERLTIVCYEGSYAHQYALSHGFKTKFIGQ